MIGDPACLPKVTMKGPVPNAICCLCGGSDTVLDSFPYQYCRDCAAVSQLPLATVPLLRQTSVLRNFGVDRWADEGGANLAGPAHYAKDRPGPARIVRRNTRPAVSRAAGHFSSERELREAVIPPLTFHPSPTSATFSQGQIIDRPSLTTARRISAPGRNSTSPVPVQHSFGVRRKGRGQRPIWRTPPTGP